ncbi:hypothetical protein EG328_000923 [Venturia inaequalis]|uniref:Uncharacterized protein n=1 Tax=Venturia inaequalis TaxID=5025 RepID=A0A8H3VJE8_VENIN|nr:hypothetical protein EG328_000923 [Venturia inaequalis]KAE9990678.1 hypothetical protein EG327_001073 [Venturia inaequalis]
MLRHDVVLPLRNPYPTGTMKPQNPIALPKDGQQYETDPALVAINLSAHSGFDTVVDNSRVMTPPPQYSRVEPSRVERPRQLTLTIPDTTQGEAFSSASPRSPDARTTPDITISQGSGTSPVESSPSGRLLDNIKAWKRKHRVGISKRTFRRPSSGSRSSSKTASPQDASSTPPWSPSGLVNEVQELDSHEINMAVFQSPKSQETSPEDSPSPDPNWPKAMNEQRPQRQSSVSSIIPTPRRFRSVAGPARQPLHANLDANVLASQLESLTEDDTRSIHDSMVSPCSPTSPSRVWHDHSRVQPGVVRSGAVADRQISSLYHPISTLTPHPRSPSPPPVTPTFDGRLGKLPRIETPTVQAVQNLSETDSGKELVVQSNDSSSSRERVHQPFLSPHWEGNAPEVATLASGSPVVVDSTNRMVQHPPPWVYTARPLKRPSPLVALTGTVLEAALGGILKTTELLRDYYGPEPPVPERHVRVRWKCAKDVYDDYIENRPGAAAELEAHLNRVPQYWANIPATDRPYRALSPTDAYSPSSSHPSSAGSAVFSQGGNPSPLSSISSWSSQGSQSPLWDKNVSRQPTRLATSNSYTLNLKPYFEPLWLYTCVNEGKWTTKMRHLDVNASKITSDKDLAISLNALHTQVSRGKWLKLFKLRGLINIKFVQFELHRNRYADISRSPAVPCLQSGEGSTYEYAPTDLTPPVGSNYLMHLFKHPEDYDDELITYLRTPKRRDRLEIGTGWGLELVEGFLAERVWGAIAGIFLLGSLVFAIVWATRKGADLQGAFGVAGWMVAVAGLVVAWAQAVVD